MINLKKILVPTDFSEHSEKAVLYGTELAKQFGGELHLLHTFEEAPIMYGEGGAYFTPEMTHDMKTAAQKHLDEVKVEVPDEVHVVRTVAYGHSFVEIVKYAKEHAIDLVVVGTHGRGAIAHMLLGSVAEQVVRQAPCPVLVVRDQEHDFVMP